MGDSTNQAEPPAGFYVYVVISLLTYVTEISINLTASYVLFDRHDYLWFSLTLGLVLVTVFVTQLISALWISRDASRWTRYASWLFHVVQLGVVWRHCQLGLMRNIDDKKREVSELCLLRAIHAFCSSVPLLLLWSSYVIHLHLDHHWTMVAAMVTCFISACWALATFRHEFSSSDPVAVVTWPDTMVKYLWRFGELAARVLSVTLFTAVYGYWTFLVLGLHWFVMLVWSLLQNLLVSGSLTRCQAMCHSLITSYMYLYCYLNTHSGHPKYRIVFFYIVMTIENAGLMALGIMFGERGIVQVGLSIAGLISMMIAISAAYLYYRFFHVTLEKSDMNKEITDGKNGCINCRLSVCVKHNFMLQRPFNRAWIELRKSESMQCLIPGSRIGSYESIDYLYYNRKPLNVLEEDTELELSYDDMYTTYMPLTASSYTNYSAVSYHDKISDLYSEAQFSTRTLAAGSHFSKHSANSAKSNTSKHSDTSKTSSNNYPVHSRPHSQLSNGSKSSTNRNFHTSSVITHSSTRTEKSSQKLGKNTQDTASSPLPAKDYYKTFFTDELDSIYQGSVNSALSSQKSKPSQKSSQKSKLKQNYSPIHSDTQSDNNAAEKDLYAPVSSNLLLTPASSIVNLLCGTNEYCSSNLTTGTSNHYQKRSAMKQRRAGRRRQYNHYNIGWHSDLSSLSEYEGVVNKHDQRARSRQRPNYPHQNHRKLREYVRSKQRTGRLIGSQNQVTKRSSKDRVVIDPLRTKYKKMSHLPSSEIKATHITVPNSKLSVRATGYQSSNKTGHRHFVKMPIKTNGLITKGVVDRLSPRAIVTNGILKNSSNGMRNLHESSKFGQSLSKSSLSSSGDMVDKLSPRARVNVAVHKSLTKNGVIKQSQPTKTVKTSSQNGLRKTGFVTSDGEELYILKPLKMNHTTNHKHIVLNDKLKFYKNGETEPTDRYIVLDRENRKNSKPKTGQKNGLVNPGFINDITDESKRGGTHQLTSAQPDLLCAHSDIDSINGLSDYSFLDSTQDGSSMDPHWYECYSDTESTEVWGKLQL